MLFITPDPGGRYRRRAEEGRRRLLLFLLAAAALAIFFYWRGAENIRSSESACQQKSVAIQQERGSLEQEITTLRSELQSAQIRYQQLEEKYKQEVPSGALKQLTDLVRKQLESGIGAERLVSAVNSARPPRNCSAPVIKRFVIKTPVYSGPHGSVTFANGSIIVTGEGVSAVGVGGKAEAWYDSGKPVSITFIETGGKKTVKTGLLPIQHAIVIADKEYRFTVAAGERSFISVTSDNCDYP